MFVLERLINVLAPHHCINCGAEGGLICTWCRPDAVIPLPSRCYICKTTTSDFAICERCKPKSRLRHAWLVSEYEGLAKKLMHTFKFERAQAAAQTIGALMADALPYLSKNTILIPVPTATSRMRIRGYDHTLLLAQAVSRHSGLHYLPVVGRIGQSRQVGAKRQMRLQQLDQAFFIKRPASVKGADVVLVDDIVTTGGTLESVARVLKRAGAKSVNALVFAQKT